MMQKEGESLTGLLFRETFTKHHSSDNKNLLQQNILLGRIDILLLPIAMLKQSKSKISFLMTYLVCIGHIKYNSDFEKSYTVYPAKFLQFSVRVFAMLKYCLMQIICLF
jgi:hypothetical protein